MSALVLLEPVLSDVWQMLWMCVHINGYAVLSQWIYMHLHITHFSLPVLLVTCASTTFAQDSHAQASLRTCSHKTLTSLRTSKKHAPSAQDSHARAFEPINVDGFSRSHKTLLDKPSNEQKRAQVLHLWPISACFWKADRKKIQSFTGLYLVHRLLS